MEVSKRLNHARRAVHAGLLVAATTACSFGAPAQNGAELHLGSYVARVQTAGKRWNFRSDKETYRFEVRGRERSGGDTGRNRSEIYLSPRLDTGKLYRISFALLLEPGRPNKAAWLNLMQVQSSFDKGEPGHSPPIGLGLHGERLALATNRSTARIARPADIVFDKRYEDRVPIRRNRWYRMELVVRHDPFRNGVLQLWRDDRCLASVVGPVGFNDEKGPYLKFGVYRAETKETFAARFAGIRVEPLATPPACRPDASPERK